MRYIILVSECTQVFKHTSALVNFTSEDRPQTMALILSTCLHMACENVDIASLQALGLQKNYNKMCDINRLQKAMQCTACTYSF